MSIKQFETRFSQIADKPSLRIDSNYRQFVDVMDLKVWENSDTPLSYFLRKVDSEKRKKGLLEEPEILVDMSNVERRFNNLIDLSPTYEIGSDKNVLGQGHIVVPKIQPRMGNIFLNASNKAYLGSSEFVEYLCDTNKMEPKFLFYVLCHPSFLGALSLSESGKTHRRVNPDELLSYKIPYIDIKAQKDALNKIEKLEEEIIGYKNKIIPATMIIDDFFEKEFNVTKDTVQSNYRPRFNKSLRDFSYSYDLRSAFRYNSYKYSFLELPLFMKHRFSEVIDKEGTSLGRQMSPDEIMEESDVYYINTNAIKLDGFDENVLTPISEDFYDLNKQLKVKKNDILLISSGEGSIGRATIFNSDKNCITSQFVMKLRPKKGVNIMYILYYMHSFYFQFTVEKYKKGKGNMTNIFAAQVLNFPILLPSEARQNEIVDLITKKLQEQHKNDSQIMSLREEIDKVIGTYLGLKSAQQNRP